MSYKKEVTIIVPDEFVEISVDAVRLCELFIFKVIAEKNSVIEIKVDGESDVVTSNSKTVKEIVSMYVKTGKLKVFYDQLIEFSKRGATIGESSLKITVHDKTYIIRLMEFNFFPNLHFRISKFAVES